MDQALSIIVLYSYKRIRWPSIILFCFYDKITFSL